MQEQEVLRFCTSARMQSVIHSQGVSYWNLPRRFQVAVEQLEGTPVEKVTFSIQEGSKAWQPMSALQLPDRHAWQAEVESAAGVRVYFRLEGTNNAYVLEHTLPVSGLRTTSHTMKSEEVKIEE